MAVTFTDLLKQINSRVTFQTVNAGISGFAKGFGLNVPSFESSATSMAWLLRQARATRKITQDTSRHTGITSYDPRTLMAEALSTVKDKSKDKETKEGEKEGVSPPTATVNHALRAGELIMYVYDPKTKDKLPYYDTFPLVFPIELKSDGFLGINMHYLPPTHRAVLMDALYSLINNLNMDSTTRLQISYEILKGATQFREFKPCIKRYLASHIRSARLTVHPSQWEQVLFLPLARFVKEDQLRVWNDSLNKINGIKRRK